ncbi:MAG: putative lipid II flippase FtsW [bacterium]
MRIHNRPDKFLFIIIIVLSLVGLFVFISASLGLLNRDGASFGLVALKQASILLFGFILMILVSKIDFHFWQRWAMPIFVSSVLMTALVFVPGIGFEHGGARRWLDIGPASFQPSEFLKLGIIVFLATWYGVKKDRAQSVRFGLVPFLLVSAVAYLLLKYQPDTGTFLVTAITALGIFILAGARWRYLFLILLLGVIAISIHIYQEPYAMNRIKTFLNPSNDITGSSYQINQSMIAIGSGGLLGRGFGQSIQKFKFLPEPIGDSIFAVASEEFGFVGASLIVLLYLTFAAWGLKIMGKNSDPFGRLLGCGLVILITVQAFINISAMLGLIPLTGVPLMFISHGGSALLMALLEAGIILNISRYK